MQETYSLRRSVASVSPTSRDTKHTPASSRTTPQTSPPCNVPSQSSKPSSSRLQRCSRQEEEKQQAKVTAKQAAAKENTAAKEKVARERLQQLVEDVVEPIITSPSVTRWRTGKRAGSAKNQGMRITCAGPRQW